jgi:hypothetical protein
MEGGLEPARGFSPAPPRDSRRPDPAWAAHVPWRAEIPTLGPMVSPVIHYVQHQHPSGCRQGVAAHIGVRYVCLCSLVRQSVSPLRPPPIQRGPVVLKDRQPVVRVRQKCRRRFSLQPRQPQPVRAKHVHQRAQHALVRRAEIACQFLTCKLARGFHQQSARPGRVTDMRTQQVPPISSCHSPQKCSFKSVNRSRINSRPFPGRISCRSRCPRMGVRNEDRVQARFQRRIDVGFRAVARHPRALRIDAALLHQRPVGGHVLLLHDGRVAEVSAQARAVDLQLLLVGMALGKQRQIVPRRQVFQRLRPRPRSLPWGNPESVRQTTSPCPDPPR